jgi:putative transposon-encoded protein
VKNVKLELVTELNISGIVGFMKRKGIPFSSGAKIDSPNEFLGKTVYLVIMDE